MRPRSSPSDVGGDHDRPSSERGLFDGVLARGPVWDATTDRAWLQAMLDSEAALAWALVDVGLVRADDAKAVEACCRAERFDAAALGREAVAGGNPAIPLVGALRALVGGTAADVVHRGATSQDIVDTAAALVAHRALDVLLPDLDTAADRAADLARTHRDTAIAGRTLLQQAVPTTFGLKAASWLEGLRAAAERLADVRDRRLTAQLGGAAGTLAGFGSQGVAVLERYSARVGLAAAVMPWHTERTRVAELASALGGTAGAAGKVATDIVLLAQTEVAEVSERRGEGEDERGGSSTMPHKHNPVAAISARAAAIQAPGLVATLFAAMLHEHERAAGAWHAEWRPLTDLLRLTGSAVSWLGESLARLDVDTERMHHNLCMTAGTLLADRVADALAPALGRAAAQDVLRTASRRATTAGRPLVEILTEDPRVTDQLDRETLAHLLDPADAIGCAPELVDRALARHDRRS